MFYPQIISESHKELLEETKKNNTVTSRQNRLTIILTVAIIALGVCTSISQLFPISEYKVISSSYLVRINKITGKIKYIDITEELDKATEESWEKATKEYLKEKALKESTEGLN